MSYLLDNKVSLEDSANLTAFSRLRTSHTKLLGEWRYMYGTITANDMNDKLEGNGSIEPNLSLNSFLAKVTTASGDRVVRQTKEYISYIAGTNTLAFVSFTTNTPKANVHQSIGMFDDYNGIFLRIKETIPEVVIRKSTNFNTITENSIPQSEWNIDKLDGSKSKYNKSGILIDFSKSQILVLDYQWLGLGRVRIGFSIDGQIVYVHEFTHANYVTEVYTTQPTLPIRFEIQNIGTTTSNSALMMICAAAYAEGADIDTGASRSISTGVNAKTITTAANTSCILAIRLKNSLNGKPNRTTAKFSTAHVITDNDINYKVVLAQSNSIFSNVTWTSISGLGWTEYSTNAVLSPTWNSANNFNVIVDDFALGGGGTGANLTAADSTQNFNNKVSTIHQNYDSTDSQILMIIGTRLISDAAVRASIQWTEQK